MRLIPTRVHGFMDYAMAVVLIASPWLFGFDEGGLETWLPVSLGVATIIYSFLTDYELGVVNVLPMSTHLILDMLSGALLAVSPWLFGFEDIAWAPHLILGLIEVVAAAMTRRIPDSKLEALVDRDTGERRIAP